MNSSPSASSRWPVSCSPPRHRRGAGRHWESAVADGSVGDRTMCARHHNVETHLRCGKCGTPICPKCLVHTPVGARCPKCAAPPRSARRGGSPLSYILATLAGLGVGMVGGVVLTFLQFGAFMILPLLLLGFLVGEAVGATARRSYGTSL